jgi:transposase
MQESSTSSAPAEAIAAYIGIDWAERKHDIILRSAAEPRKAEYFQITHEPNALMDWLAALQQRFGAEGKIAIGLEQSHGALIFYLMGYEFLELYPINPSQLSKFRETFRPSGAKDDRSDAELLCELLYCHRDRLRVWKPDDEQTRKLAFLNEGRRQAVDRRTELSNTIKSHLKIYFPLALEVLDFECSTALAANLLLHWPDFESLQKQSAHKLRQFFYAHHSRQEKKILERLELIKAAKPLTRDRAVIESGALCVQLLAQQLKSLLPFIIRYEKQIALLFTAHPDSFLFRDLPGAGAALGPRLVTAFGTDRERFKDPCELCAFSGIGPIRRASGKKSRTKDDEKVSVHFRRACPKFLRQSFHEFGECSIRYCPWAHTCYKAHRDRGKGHHAAVRAVTFKWIRILFACWKKRIPYDPQRYLQALQTRGSDYAVAAL